MQQGPAPHLCGPRPKASVPWIWAHARWLLTPSCLSQPLIPSSKEGDRQPSEMFEITSGKMLQRVPPLGASAQRLKGEVGGKCWTPGLAPRMEGLGVAGTGRRPGLDFRGKSTKGPGLRFSTMGQPHSSPGGWRRVVFARPQGSGKGALYSQEGSRVTTRFQKSTNLVQKQA